MVVAVATPHLLPLATIITENNPTVNSHIRHIQTMQTNMPSAGIVILTAESVRLIPTTVILIVTETTPVAVIRPETVIHPAIVTHLVIVIRPATAIHIAIVTRLVIVIHPATAIPPVTAPRLVTAIHHPTATPPATAIIIAAPLVRLPETDKDEPYCDHHLDLPVDPVQTGSDAHSPQTPTARNVKWYTSVCERRCKYCTKSPTSPDFARYLHI